jgi:3-deoxy-manno-octulosonate cytidylyltransferase (CMP-KDO synthetase)
MKSVIIIPARYKSSRFPGKPLALIKGIPMIIRVANLCNKIFKKKDIYIATDSYKIKQAVTKFGFNAVMTKKQCLTGTDRVAEAAKKIKADIYINVQGDEPLIDPKDILKVINYKKKNFNYVINCYAKINNENPSNTNIPKVVINQKKDLVYMSRALIPGSKKENKKENYFYKQVCIYAFNFRELHKFSSRRKKSNLELIEDIEILRFFELSIPVKMLKLEKQSLAVDTSQDLKKIQKYFD